MALSTVTANRVCHRENEAVDAIKRLRATSFESGAADMQRWMEKIVLEQQFALRDGKSINHFLLNGLTHDQLEKVINFVRSFPPEEVTNAS